MSRVVYQPKVQEDGFDLGVLHKPATPYIIDMKSVKSTYWARDEKGLMRTYLRDDRAVTSAETNTAEDGYNVPNGGAGLLLSDSQVRARARRRLNRGARITEASWNQLGIKPVEEWTMEELAKGVPRNADGRWPTGRRSKLVTRAMHERAMELFVEDVKGRMNGQAIDALKVLDHILTDDEEDDKGKPRTPASVKLQAASMLIEHVVGKPKQQIKQDISVKLQGILGTVMVNPTMDEEGSMKALPSGYDYAHVGTRGVIPSMNDPIDVDVVEDEDDLD